MARTLGQAYQLGWRITVCCIWGAPNPQEQTRTHAHRMRYRRRTRHEDTRLDARRRLSARSIGKPYALSAMRVATRNRSIQYSWRTESTARAQCLAGA